MATPARLAGVGVFVLGGLFLFTVGLFMIGDRQMAFAKKFTVFTEFRKITGLQPGAIVRVSGAKAGAITEILPPDTPNGKFRVKLEITEDLHQLVRTDSLATIETEGLVGGSYLGIGIGTEAAAPVPPDATIAGKEPFEITDLMQQMGDTIKNVNDTIDGLKDDVERAVLGIADTVDKTNSLIAAVSDDLQLMAKSGSSMASDAAQITAAIRNGEGSLGKLVHDDELYNRVAAISKQVEGITEDAREVVKKAKATLEGFDSKDGPVQGMTASVKQTMDDASSAMAGFAANMEALKHNFLVRGYFKGRGYYSLAQMSPADYRQGVLIKGSDRQAVRVWLRSDLLFEGTLKEPEDEELTEAGKAALNAAISPYLEHLASGIVIVEGYAQQGARDEQYLQSRARASVVRDYLIAQFHLDPETTGAMPLGADAAGSPDKAAWEGVALAVILPKAALAKRK